MSFTVDDIKRFVSPIHCGEHDWDNFVYHLRAVGDKGIYMPQIGIASLVEEDHDDDRIYLVFVVKHWDGERHFMLSADSASFGGIGNARLEEVSATTVQKTVWERI